MPEDGGTSEDGGPTPDGGTPEDGGPVADGGATEDGGPVADGGVAEDGGTAQDGGMAQNHVPTLTPIAPQTVRETSVLELKLTASDTDQQQTLVFSGGAGNPSWAEVSGSGATPGAIEGLLRLSPADGQAGDYPVIVQVTDGVTSVEATIQVKVAENLEAPAGISASEGTSTAHVAVTWLAVAEADSYALYRATEAAGTYQEIATHTGLSFNDASAQPGLAYYYKVKAYSGQWGWSGFSPPDSGYRKLGVPTAVKASDGTSTAYIEVTWQSVIGSNRTLVFRADAAGGTYTQVGSTSGTSHQDRSATPGRYYFYKVRAHADSSNSDGELSGHDRGHRMIAKATGVKASDGAAPNYIDVTWNAVNGADRYDVYRSNYYLGGYSKIGSVTGTSFKDTAVWWNHKFYYRIWAYSDTLQATSGQSDSYDTGYVLPPAPSGLKATDGLHEGKIAVNWSNLHYTLQFHLYRAESEAGAYTKIAATGNTASYNDTGAQPARRYYYKVRAHHNDWGWSGYSAVDPGYRKLAAPLGLTASDGTLTDRVEVNWSSVPGATAYHLLRADTPSGSYAEVASTDELSYGDGSAAEGIRYHYKVAAFFPGFGPGEASAPDSGYRRLEAPGAPTVSAGTSTTHVEITWTAVAGADLYRVYRSTTLDGTYTQLGNASATSYNDAAAQPGLVYYYKISAYAGSSDSWSDKGDSGTGHRALAAPTGLTATDGTSVDEVVLSWDAVTGADGYRVYRSESESGTFTELANPVAPAFGDTTAEPGKRYYYEVAARADSSASWSARSAVEPGYRGLAAPTGLTASDGASTSEVALNWDSVTGADGYRIYRSESASGTFTELAAPGAASYDDTAATPGFLYHYKVAARSDSSASTGLMSAAEQGYRKLAVPTGLTASDGAYTAHVRLTWNAVTGADSYSLSRARTAGGPFSDLASGIQSPYEDTSAAPGLWYHYKVRAHADSSASSSDESAAEQGFRKLAAPTGVAAGDGTHTDRIEVSWNSVTGADRYHLYRSLTDTMPATTLAETTAASYSDAAVTAGATYRYWVKALADDTSSQSDASTAETGYRKLLPPTEVAASDGTYGDRVQITWEATAGADRYYVYRSPSAGGTYVKLSGEATGTLFEDTGVPDWKDYYYKVAAHADSSASTSDLSAMDSGYRTHHTLTVEIEGGGSGTVTAGTGGLSCPGTCAVRYAPGTVVTLTQHPGSQNSSSTWNRGGCYGSGATPCTVTMSRDRWVTAVLEDKKNIVFVTSLSYSPASTNDAIHFTGVAGADAKCNERAQAAGLTGNFKAWISQHEVNARDRITATGARGWVRTDGRAFGDTVDDLLTGKTYYPPRLDEYGNDVGSADALTGTYYSGNVWSTYHCSNWTSTSSGHNMAQGSPDSSGTSWPGGGITTCDQARRLYCFQTDYANPVTAKRHVGPLAFFSKNGYALGSGGITALDGRCTSEASTAGRQGKFQALLALNGKSAAQRFSAMGPGWVRLDGVQVYPRAADLYSADFLTAAIMIDATGWRGAGSAYFWAGAPSPKFVCDASCRTCSDWTSTSTSTYTRPGNFVHTDAYFFGNGPHRNCGSTYRLYCLQDNRYNIMFITSTVQDGALGGLSGADTICKLRAEEANLPGDPALYKAWLSTEGTGGVSAASRLESAQGWVRPDGVPFAASVEAIVAGEILSPPRVDEAGSLVDDTAQVYTGTLADGTVKTGYTCANWTAAAAYTNLGDPMATAVSWTHHDPGPINCRMPARIYCFGTHYQNPVYPLAEEGRLAFVSQGAFNPGTGGGFRRRPLPVGGHGSGADRLLPGPALHHHPGRGGALQEQRPHLVPGRPLEAMGQRRRPGQRHGTPGPPQRHRQREPRIRESLDRGGHPGRNRHRHLRGLVLHRCQRENRSDPLRQRHMVRRQLGGLRPGQTDLLPGGIGSPARRHFLI